MSSSNILHPAGLGSMDEEEVGETLGVVEEDQQGGEVGGGQALQPDISIYYYFHILTYHFLIFNLGMMKGKAK